jgi:hypothetical protein
VIEQALIMRDEQHAALGGTQAVDALRDDLERVDVEAGIRLVEYRERGLEHEHLQDFVALLLAAREPFVDAALEEALVDLHELHLRAHELQEIVGIDFGLPLRLQFGVQRGFQQIDVVDARDFDRILEPEEQARARAFFGRQREQILAAILHAAAGYLVPGPAGEHV